MPNAASQTFFRLNLEETLFIASIPFSQGDLHQKDIPETFEIWSRASKKPPATERGS
jgi:hypothetical protein